MRIRTLRSRNIQNFSVVTSAHHVAITNVTTRNWPRQVALEPDSHCESRELDSLHCESLHCDSTPAKPATNYLTLDLSEVRKNLAPDVSDLYVGPEVEHQFHVLAHSSEVPG